MSLQCLFGVPSTQGNGTSSSCSSCAPDAMTDSTFFHAGEETCTLPLAMFHAGNAVMAGAALGVCLVAGLRLRQSLRGGHRDLRREMVFGLVLVQQVFVVLTVVALWVEGRSNPWFWWFAGFTVFIEYVLVIAIMDNFFFLNAKLYRITLSKDKLNMAYALMFVTGSIPLVIVTFGTTLATTTNEYNAVVVSFFVTLPLHELTAVPVIATVPRDLLRGLEDTLRHTTTTAHADVIRQFTTLVSRLRIFLVFVIAPMITSSCLTISIVFLVLGYFPFQYVLVLMIVGSLPALGAVTLWGHPVGSASSSASPPTPRRSMVVAPKREDGDDDGDNEGQHILSRIHGTSQQVVPMTHQLSVGPAMSSVQVTRVGGLTEQGSVERRTSLVTFENVVREAGEDGIVIVDPETAAVSVFPKHSVEVSQAHTLVARWGVSSQVLRRIERGLTFAELRGASRAVQLMFPVLVTLPMLTVVVVTLIGVVPPLMGVLHLFMATIGSITLFMLCADWDVFRLRLLPTSFYLWRTVTALVGGALLVDCLALDARVTVVPGIVLGQLLAFSGDSFVPMASGLRTGIVLGALAAVLTVFVLFQFDLMTLRVTSITFSTFSFSLAQLCRDLHLFAAVLLLEEFLFLLRQGHRRRFMHISKACLRTIIPFPLEQEMIATRGGGGGGGSSGGGNGGGGAAGRGRGSKFEASDLFVASGFFAAEQETPKNDVAPPQRVWVEHVIMKESSALAFQVWGDERGALIVSWLDSRAFKTLIGLMDSLVIVALICMVLGLGVGQKYLPMAAVPATFVQILHTTPRMHTTILVLLLRRVELYLQLGFVLAWTILVGIHFGFDARWTLAVYALVSYALQQVHDASVHLQSRNALLNRVVVIGVILTISVGLLLHAIPNVQPTIFLSGTAGASTASSTPDDPAVWDLSQTAFDLGVSIGLHTAVVVLNLVSWHQPVRNGDGSTSSVFEVVRLPVVPAVSVGVGGDVAVSVSSGPQRGGGG